MFVFGEESLFRDRITYHKVFFKEDQKQRLAAVVANHVSRTACSDPHFARAP